MRIENLFLYDKIDNDEFTDDGIIGQIATM